ncbi:MAG: hypothetical protein DFNUSKGM_000347 [Candidatus Fervidibacter sacchari]
MPSSRERQKIHLSCGCEGTLRQIKNLLERYGWQVSMDLDEVSDDQISARVQLGTPLSKQQLQVLQALADEGTVKGAATRLGLKRATIHKHLHNINQILGARSTLHAVVIAMRRRLIR